jgi:succinyl-CoA synthetase alpha subunit
VAILTDKTTRLIVQGITGREGSFYTKQMSDYGTSVLGGVTPGKGGEWVHGKPVFDSVVKAIDATGANASIIFAPATSAADAIYEAVDANIELIVCITQGIPVLDMMKIRAYAEYRNSRLIGPNCPGLITPHQSNIGIIPGFIAQSGSVGVVSRSGTLTYDIIYLLTQADIGQSTCVGIGCDPIVGTNFVDILRMFEEDPETETVVLIGEIGGRTEIDAAEYVKAQMTKPVVAYIVGKSAPNTIPLGHAGALIDGIDSTATRKIDALLAAGARVADQPEDIPALLRNRVE